MRATLFGSSGKDAVLSTCGTYRYELRRDWDQDLPWCGWLMLNPSTADASVDDPTIRRCISFAKGWGAGGIIVVNLFALRATKPTALKTHYDPIGSRNDGFIREAAEEAAVMVCAWGAHEMAAKRSQTVLAQLHEVNAPVRCLGVTKSGAPRHPLYVKGDTELAPFPLPAAPVQDGESE